MGYIAIIKTSVLLFPILAALITIPYMIWMYRKYGAINFVKTLMVYSFILYLESSFLLVILPLPEVGSVTNSYQEMINFIPFSFVIDFIHKSPFQLLNPSTYLQAIKHWTFYVPVFNVLMVLPFGMYLKYYFKCDLKKTFLFSALLSLFFEITQVSGLFFMYNGPYRLADVDDLIQNTLGGVLGYYVAILVEKVLPSREELDTATFKKGQEVSGLRRLLALIIDFIVINMISSIFGTFSSVAFHVLIVLYFAILPQFKGKTIGSSVLKFHFEMDNKNIIRLLFRSSAIWIYFIVFPNVVFYVLNLINGNFDSRVLATLFFVVFMLFVVYVIFTLFIVLSNRKLPFDKVATVTYFSEVNVSNSKI